MTKPDGFSFQAAAFNAASHTLSLEDAVQGILTGRGLIWLDIVVDDVDKTSAFLRNTLGFHELEVEDALSTNERPSFSADDETMFMVIPSASVQEGGLLFTDVAIFAGKSFVVTVHDRPSTALTQWFNTCHQRVDAAGKSSIKLVHSIADHLVDGYFPILDDVVDQIEDLEDRVYAGGHATMGDAMTLKRKLLDLRRHVVPIRDVINGALRRDNPLMTEGMMPYFQDVYDHCLRIVEIIDNERDVMSGVLDAHLAVVSNKLNIVMRQMTVISTILMTCGLVAGIYGMNFPNIPEFRVHNGYFICLGVMAALSIGELIIFKKLKWF